MRSSTHLTSRYIHLEQSMRLDIYRWSDSSLIMSDIIGLINNKSHYDMFVSCKFVLSLVDVGSPTHIINYLWA